MLILSLTKLLIFKILSLHVTFFHFSPTNNLYPLIWQYWPKLLSIESLWNRAVNTNLKPSDKKSSIKEVWHKWVLCKAEYVWAEKVNCSQFGILLLCHLLSNAAISRKNPGLLSFCIAVLPNNYQNNTDV